MKKSINLSLLIVFILVSSVSLFAQEDVTSSIVKIYTVYNKHSYFRPWQMDGHRSGRRMMGKKRPEPPAWKWEEGVVDTKEEYNKIGHKGFEHDR